MKRKNFLVLWVMGILLFCLATFVGAGYDVEDVLKIRSSLWPSPTRGAVEFTHEQHARDYDISCNTCHHVFENQDNVWQEGDPVDKCQKCHYEPTITGERGLPPDQQKLNLKLAFHSLCQDCHRARNRDDITSQAPITCRECHSGGKR